MTWWLWPPSVGPRPRYERGRQGRLWPVSKIQGPGFAAMSDNRLPCSAGHLQQQLEVLRLGAEVHDAGAQAETAVQHRVRAVDAPVGHQRGQEVLVEPVERLVVAPERLGHVAEAADRERNRGHQLEVGVLVHQLAQVAGQGGVVGDAAAVGRGAVGQQREPDPQRGEAAAEVGALHGQVGPRVARPRPARGSWPRRRMRPGAAPGREPGHSRPAAGCRATCGRRPRSSRPARSPRAGAAGRGRAPPGRRSRRRRGGAPRGARTGPRSREAGRSRRWRWCPRWRSPRPASRRPRCRPPARRPARRPACASRSSTATGRTAAVPRPSRSAARTWTTCDSVEA